MQGIKQQQQSMPQTETPETVRVAAPATLNEGYAFDVTVEDGRTYTVTVPAGGVKAGEIFDAPVSVSSPIVATATPLYPEVAMVPTPDDENPSTNPGLSLSATGAPTAPVFTSSTTTKTIVNNLDGTQTVTEETAYPDGRISKRVTTFAAGAAPPTPLAVSALKSTTSPPASTDVPTGQWRYELFSCCSVCDSGMFWMAWCCTYIAIGQLLQRMKMNVCGQPGDYSNTCMIWTILWVVCYIIWWILVGVTDGFGVVIFYLLTIFALVALTQVRYFMRQKWSIPADCCEESGCLSDCCCVYWCSCCSVIQMMRHTHAESVYYYKCGSATGLQDDAPEVV